MAGRIPEVGDWPWDTVSRLADETAAQWADDSDNDKTSDIYAHWTDCISRVERDMYRRSLPWAHVQIDLFRGG